MKLIRDMIQIVKTTKRFRCSEIWGGIGNTDLDVATRPLTSSLYSRPSHGGKGGDICYLSVCSDGSIVRIAVADVLGHGDAVSEMSQWLYDALAARMRDGDDNRILADLNRLAADFGRKAFTTAVVLSFRADNSKLYFSYAGHPPVWIRPRKDGVWRSLVQKPQAEPTNLPLGMFPESAYDQKQLQLRSGDRLFVHTDGLTDAFNPAGEQFGEDRLQAALAVAGDLSLFDLKQRVLAAVRSHTGGSLGHDDVTLVAMEVH